MSYLNFRNVWMIYNGQVVLERIDLDVEQHSFCTIVGASGCGKSTFLRLLLSQEQPSRGHIRLDGKPLPPEPGPERGIVFQRYSVFPHLTVLQNVMLGLELEQAPWLGRVFGPARKRLQEEACTALEAVGLVAARDKYPFSLSGGMQQRLSIAQSVVKKPKLLLLDEPFGALDPGIRADMHRLILDVWRRYNMTIFMVTHDIKEGFQLGTRLLVFDKVRLDRQEPGAFGATITYDIPLTGRKDMDLSAIQTRQHSTETFLQSLA